MTITSNDPDENPVVIPLSGTGTESEEEQEEDDEENIIIDPGLREYIFTVDFLGKITTGPISVRGEMLQDIVAMSPDGTHVIEFEKGTRAFDSENTTVTYIEIRETEAPELPDNTVLVGKAYQFNPSGTVFDKSIRLTLGYDVESLPLQFTTLGTWYYIEGEGWAYLESETAGPAELGKIRTPVDHFTIFAILAGQEPPPRPAEFKLSNLSISPFERKFFTAVTFFIKTGETTAISVDVTNEGQQAGVYSATLKVNDRGIETKEVTLSPGETRTVSFSFTADERGRYTVQIGELNGNLDYELWINWWLWAGSVGLFLLLLWLIKKYLIRI